MRRLQHRDKVLALLMLAVIVLDGLSPFELRQTPSDIGWIPFGPLLGGDVARSVMILSKKAFLYGALAWLLAQPGRHWLMATIVTVVSLALIEVAQTYYAAHTPEITGPLLALLLCLMLFVSAKNGSEEVCDGPKNLGTAIFGTAKKEGKKTEPSPSATLK